MGFEADLSAALARTPGTMTDSAGNTVAVEYYAQALLDTALPAVGARLDLYATGFDVDDSGRLLIGGVAAPQAATGDDMANNGFTFVVSAQLAGAANGTPALLLNRTGAAGTELGSIIDLNVNGSRVGGLGTVGLELPQWTVATLPAAADHSGVLVRVADGNAGSPCLAVSDGAEWLRIALGTAVAAA